MMQHSNIIPVIGNHEYMAYSNLKKLNVEITEENYNKYLDEYSIIDMVRGRCDYQKQYYPDKYLVTGHTPTHFIDPEYKGKIYKRNNHIAIDCGAAYGGRLE